MRCAALLAFILALPPPLHAGEPRTASQLAAEILANERDDPAHETPASNLDASSARACALEAMDGARAQACTQRYVELQGAAAILDLLDNGTPRSDSFTVIEAGRSGDPRVRARLESIARGKDPRIEPHATALLAFIESDPRTGFDVALERAEAEVHVGTTLGFREGGEAISALSRADWTTAPPACVERALRLAEARFPTDVHPFFGCGMSAGHPAEYGGAFALLTRIGAPARTLLHRLARSDDPLKRRNALFIMTAIPDPDRTDPCARALRDEDVRVRRLAAWGLGRACRAVPALERALDDPDAIVRRRALLGLAACKSNKVVPAALELLRWEVAQPVRAGRSPWQDLLRDERQRDGGGGLYETFDDESDLDIVSRATQCPVTAPDAVTEEWGDTLHASAAQLEEIESCVERRSTHGE